MKKIFLIFICSSLWGQPDSWSFNPANYEHQMSVTAIIVGDDLFSPHEDDVLGAFNEQAECAGLANSTFVPFGPHTGEEAFLIQIYSNSFSGGETIIFKLYHYETESVVLIDNTIEFIQDGVLGSLVSPLLLTATVFEEEQTYVDDNNDGYDDTSYAAGRASADTNDDGLVDEFPAISIINGNAMILMQGSLDHYIDSGASCLDQEDGDISHQVEVSGDIININSPGTYTVFYNCSDSNGNAAQTKYRTVFIIPPTIADENEDGFDDASFMAGALSGDANLDGALNVVDLVIYIDIILNGE